jgi:hypothetical protein
MAKPANNNAVVGEILGHGSDFRQVCVRLQDGREVVVVLPKLRKYGCLFGTMVGWRARVLFRQPP